VYAHPNMPGYSVVVKRWDAQGAYCTVQSDYAFTGISYSYPNRDAAESVGFNITGVFYPEGDAMISEQGAGGRLKNIACIRDSFRLVLKTEYLPAKVEWLLKDYPGLVNNSANVVRLNPVPDSTVTRDGHTYYYFSLVQYYTIKGMGDCAIPVQVTAPAINNCAQVQTYIAEIYTGLKPVPDFTPMWKGCVPFDVKFTAGSAKDTSVITKWEWNFGDGAAATAVASHTYNTEGDKSVYLKLTARNTCMADTVKSIHLADAVRPVAEFQLPAVVCVPARPATFINQSVYTGTEPGGPGWQWDFGNGSKSSVKDPAYSYSTVQNYTVTLIATASDGCSDTVAHTLTAVHNKPEVQFSMSASRLCGGEALKLTDQSSVSPSGSVTRWNWEFGDGDQSVQQHPQKKYSQGGVKSIAHFVVSDVGCYSDTLVKEVEVFNIPRVEAGPDQVILLGASVQLRGSVQVSGPVDIEWTPALFLSDAHTTMPVAKPQKDQLYYLTAVTGNLCIAYDSVMVRVLPDLVAPAAFTPNGDGVHDTWDIPGLSSYISPVVQVFNRYGQKVFESQGYSVRWDGTSQGSPLPAGTYYYIIRPGQGRNIQTGSVTIIR